MKDKRIQVYTVNSRLEAESISLLLQSFGINSYISQESVAASMGLTVGPIARIRILVDRGQGKDAREILQSMDRGELTIGTNENDSDKVD